MEQDSGIEKKIIPFLPSIDKKKPSFLEIKYTISGIQFKKQWPIFKGGSAEELLYFLHEFMEAKAKLGYNAYQKLESGLEQLLQGTALSAWKTTKATVHPNTNTLQSFSVKVEGFRYLYIPGNAAIDNQKAHLHCIKKKKR